MRKQGQIYQTEQAQGQQPVSGGGRTRAKESASCPRELRSSYANLFPPGRQSERPRDGWSPRSEHMLLSPQTPRNLSALFQRNRELPLLSPCACGVTELSGRAGTLLSQDGYGRAHANCSGAGCQAERQRTLCQGLVLWSPSQLGSQAESQSQHLLGRILGQDPVPAFLHLQCVPSLF